MEHIYDGTEYIVKSNNNSKKYLVDIKGNKPKSGSTIIVSTGKVTGISSFVLDDYLITSYENGKASSSKLVGRFYSTSEAVTLTDNSTWHVLSDTGSTVTLFSDQYVKSDGTYTSNAYESEVIFDESYARTPDNGNTFCSGKVDDYNGGFTHFGCSAYSKVDGTYTNWNGDSGTITKDSSIKTFIEGTYLSKLKTIFNDTNITAGLMKVKDIIKISGIESSVSGAGDYSIEYGPDPSVFYNSNDNSAGYGYYDGSYYDVNDKKSSGVSIIETAYAYYLEDIIDKNLTSAIVNVMGGENESAGLYTASPSNGIGLRTKITISKTHIK